jgi:hypothetical protein
MASICELVPKDIIDFTHPDNFYSFLIKIENALIWT